MSLIDQEDHDFELILVDDCGTDDSVEKASALLLQSNLNYQIIKRAQNGGLSAARNSGINVAKGDYLYFADSDDALEPTAIASFYAAISQYPDEQVFLFNAQFRNPDDVDLSVWRQPGTLAEKLTSEDALLALYGGKIGAYIWQYLFRRDVFEHLRFKEGSVWEDAIIVPQILSATERLISLDHRYIYRYYLRHGSISQSIHPQLKGVIAALDEVEDRLYSNKQGTLYFAFVQYRTSILMRLSRECFVRTNDFEQLMGIHRQWAASIPRSNIRGLWMNGKKRSAVFLWMTKHTPWALYFLYLLKLLK